MAEIFLSLGTNLGDRLENLRRALECIAAQVHILQLSSVYETPPWGYTEQPAFLNLVLRAETELEPQALLDFLKSCEKKLGRQPSFRYGPRLIDLDILAYEDRIVETPNLILPHPHLHERAFVLVPLCEIAPDWKHPRLGQRAIELLAACDPTDIRKVAILDLESKDHPLKPIPFP
ncbi:MAG: 2-amino-4-hydroxy-6-hydroxymethyldihydropteridine diphosphokinase [Anaerolineales bacterium]